MVRTNKSLDEVTTVSGEEILQHETDPSIAAAQEKTFRELNEEGPAHEPDPGHPGGEPIQGDVEPTKKG